MALQMMVLTEEPVQDKNEILTDERIRLLLIDDNAEDVEVLSNIVMAQDDIEFFHCSASSALDVASSVNPTVIMQALHMAASDGLDLVRTFREQKEFSEIPVVVLFSKDDGDEIRESIFLAGADDILPKTSGEIETIHRIRYHSRAYTERQALQSAIKDIKEIREQIFKSEKMASIGQLAAGVAHEINNPVAFIASNINSMSSYYEDVFSVINAYDQMERTLSADLPEVKAVREIKERLQIDYLKEDIKQIMSECDDGLTRIRNIVEDLKNFSREEKIEWQTTDLHRELDSTLNIANHEIKYKAEVNKEYGDIPDIECVTSQLNQVFLNLFVNAAHAIDDHGTITLKTSTGTLPDGLSEKKDGAEETSEESWVCISVGDTGCGIDKEAIPKIFDAFFTTKPAGKGTGLGLSLSRSIVQKHGGHFTVDSEPGKGTTFSVWLPVHQHDTVED